MREKPERRLKMYEIRNQHENCPYEDGLKDEIISTHENDLEYTYWNGSKVTILGHKKIDNITIIEVHIEGI